MELQFSMKAKIQRLRIVGVEHRHKKAIKRKAKENFFPICVSLEVYDKQYEAN